jgi:hypothetical protein
MVMLRGSEESGGITVQRAAMIEIKKGPGIWTTTAKYKNKTPSKGVYVEI